MPQPTFQPDVFVQRLTQLLTARSMSQSQLAAALGVSRSTVTGWIRHQKLPDAYLIHGICQALRCSADWLLDLSDKQDASGRIRWTEYDPPITPDRARLRDGLALFQQMMAGTAKPTAQNQSQARALLQAVFRAGMVRLLHVARHEAYEEQLEALYPHLLDVIVVDVPAHITEPVIRTELVAYHAMTSILSRLTRPLAVGLGSGYTMLRLCEQSIPSVDQFSGTAWIPLLSFSASNVEDYTANHLARLMSLRHTGSHALYLPHPDECTTPDLRATAQDTLQRMRNVPMIFVSASGVDRRHASGEAHLLAQFRSADYISEAPDLRDQYADLPDKEQFGAEILRYLIDTQGHVLSRDPSVGAQADLEILRYLCATAGQVCLVAACGYKARAVQTCLKNQLVNTLVIDSEIAAYLLMQA